MLDRKSCAEFIDTTEMRICLDCTAPETSNQDRYYGLLSLKLLREMADVLKTLPDENPKTETESSADCPPWTESAFPETPVAEPVKTITLEEVRAELAAARIEGKVDVPGLVRSFGAKKLGEIPPERYGELLDSLRALQKEAS